MDAGDRPEDHQASSLAPRSPVAAASAIDSSSTAARRLKHGYTVAVQRNPLSVGAVLPCLRPIRGAAVAAVFATVLSASSAIADAGQSLSVEGQLAFLNSAKVLSSRPIGKGITGALRLTLSDGTLTHDAAFQRVDQKNSNENLRQGKRIAGELLFVDAYRYNIAAWELARLLQLADMVPATVERSHAGQRGALSWWVDDVLMDEEERERSSAVPPGGVQDLVRQKMIMAVFTELVRDTDRNKGNVLYTNQWRVIMLDFTRAFRLEPALRRPETLARCSRELLSRLRALTRDDVAHAVGKQLTADETNAMMKRRDLIVQRFDQLVATHGEAAVLF